MFQSIKVFLGITDSSYDFFIMIACIYILILIFYWITAFIKQMFNFFGGIK